MSTRRERAKAQSAQQSKQMVIAASKHACSVWNVFNKLCK